VFCHWLYALSPIGVSEFQLASQRNKLDVVVDVEGTQAMKNWSREGSYWYLTFRVM